MSEAEEGGGAETVGGAPSTRGPGFWWRDKASWASSTLTPEWTLGGGACRLDNNNNNKGASTRRYMEGDDIEKRLRKGSPFGPRAPRVSPPGRVSPGLRPGGPVDGVRVEHGAVGRRPDGLPVELHLLLGVPELQAAGPLVGGGLLAVRQADGGRQVHLALRQVRPGGLEAARRGAQLEALRLQGGQRLGRVGVPRHAGRGPAAVRGPRVVHLVLRERKRRQDHRRGAALTLANGRCRLRAGACLESSERADRR
ncbi:hypothetical protein EYF80_052060 [Liparis tanakae]|uniref:Uncharacterized protein n=1 Tax=Liparis tanakae TaxID=230148 RepID=A0A4Z2FAH4_9TELE|nr:hypothetical protein EYF80_052060 [Liparis tanakae]